MMRPKLSAGSLIILDDSKEFECFGDKLWTKELTVLLDKSVRILVNYHGLLPEDPIESIILPDGLTKKFLKIIEHFITSVKFYMPKYQLGIKFTNSDMLLQVTPSVEADTHVTCSLHEIYFVGVLFKLEDHGDMVEVTSRDCSCDFWAGLCPSE